jgi:hypothetical protein
MSKEVKHDLWYVARHQACILLYVEQRSIRAYKFVKGQCIFQSATFKLDVMMRENTAVS